MTKDWRDDVANMPPREARDVVFELLPALGRRMFKVLQAEHPATLQALNTPENTEASDYALASGRQHPQTLVVEGVAEQTPAAALGHIPNAVIQLIKTAWDMQANNIPRRPASDGRAARYRKRFEMAYAALVDETRKHGELKDILPIASAVSALAQQQDISAFAEKRFAAGAGEAVNSQQSEGIDHNAITGFSGYPESPRDLHFDDLAEEQVIQANLGKPRTG